MKIRDIAVPLSKLKGVGEVTLSHLNRLNCYTVSDLLTYWPKGWDDRTKYVPLSNYALKDANGADANTVHKVNTVARVIAHDWFYAGNKRTLKIIIRDATCTANLICFNRAFLEKKYPVGTYIMLNGVFTLRYNSLQSSSFDASPATPLSIPQENDLNLLANPNNFAEWKENCVLPLYALTSGLTQLQLRKIIKKALQQYAKGIEDELPQDVIERQNLFTKQQCIISMHAPATLLDAQKAQKTLIFEELYLFQEAIGYRSLAHRGRLPDDVQFSANVSKEIASLQNSNSFLGEGTGANVQANLGIANCTKVGSFSYANSFVQNLSPKQQKLLANLKFALTADQQSVICTINDDIDLSYNFAPQSFSTQNFTGQNFTPKNTAHQNLQNAQNTQTSAGAQITQNAQTSAGTQITQNASKSIHQIKNFSMARLLQGDVGSGKTLVAFFACARIKDYGGQSAILAPTELLSVQHAENAAKILEPIGIRLAFLTGNVKARGRNNILKSLQQGEIDIVIGTHALFSQSVNYKDLRLAIIDEQHRFGVLQRNNIIAKGRKLIDEEKNLYQNPNVLMMSATPIPQTLARSVFGDLDISTIRTMPQGRLPIKTHLTKQGSEQNVYEVVRKELNAGRQAYFVYPLIEQGLTDEEMQGGQSNQGLKSAEEMATFLQQKVFREFKLEILHSRVEEEKQSVIMEDFKNGKISILVATSVVEVGVDIPNATCMVIEHAERFGLAALHQLRGRVGRSNLQSHCFLIYSPNLTDEGKSRLKALFESTDGFFIAEQDLLLRGPGEVLGVQQSGYITLSIADPVRDKAIMDIAREEAFSHITRAQSTYAS